MKLYWKHGESNLQTEVKIKKSVSSDKGLGGSLICNICEGKLSQQYVCDCGLVFKKGEIKKRRGKIDEDIVYEEKDKNYFMDYKVSDIIKVTDEIPTSDIMENIEFLEGFYEIFNNDDNGLIKKIHNFLFKKNLTLLVEYGYLGSERAGLIFSTKNKLLLIQLRDGKLIKERLQNDLEIRANEYTEKLNAITESRDTALYKEFLNKIKNKEKIEKPIKTEQEKPITVEVDFLKDF